MRKKNSQSGVAWIEVLVIAAILLLIASLFLRVRYGQAWLAAEYSFVQSVGINRDAYDIGKITVSSSYSSATRFIDSAEGGDTNDKFPPWRPNQSLEPTAGRCEVRV